MRLAYQVATPEVHTPDVTAFRGDLREGFAQLARLGYSAVELMVRDPERVPAAYLEALSREYHLPICLVCTGEVYGEDGLSFTDARVAVRAEAGKRLRAAIRLAARLGVDVNVGRLRGRLGGGVPDEVALEWGRTALLGAADLAASLGIRVLLEPIQRRTADWARTTEEGLALVRALNHPGLGLMLDTGHMHAEGETIPSSLVAAREHLHHVHLCEENRLAPGMGHLDFPAILGALREAGYDGCVSVEAYQHPDSETAMRVSAETLLPLLG